MASLSERVSFVRVLVPLIVAVIASGAVSFAHNNPGSGAGTVAVAIVVAVVAAVFGERGAALAAIGVGAAASFPQPNGLGPLLVLTGVIVAGEIGTIDRRIVRWRYVIDALVSLPALAGLAATIAGQPSQRAVALGVAAAAAIGITLWRNRRFAVRRYAVSPVAYAAAAGALAVMFVPERLTTLGNVPRATVTAAHSLASCLAVFTLAVVADMLWAERKATRLG